MERTLVHVQPSPDGWAVALLGTALENHETKFAAIGAASAVAAQRNLTTGEPTGVSVQIGMGHVLIAMRG